MDEDSENKFCWIKLFQTVIIWMGFLLFGVCDCVRGPTILDLQNTLEVEIGQISLIFTFFSMGSLFGCFLSSLLLDKLNKYRFLVLGFSIILMGSTTAALPYSVNIYMIYVLSVVSGFSSGVKMTGGNVLCAKLWGNNKFCSSFVHANQFSWSLGAFLAPIAAKPFVNSEFVRNDDTWNATLEEKYNHSKDMDNYTVHTLYPAIGGLCNFLFIGFVIAHFKDDEDILKEEHYVHNHVQRIKKKTSILTVIMSVFLFLAIGSEVVFRLIFLEILDSNIKITFFQNISYSVCSKWIPQTRCKRSNNIISHIFRPICIDEVPYDISDTSPDSNTDLNTVTDSIYCWVFDSNSWWDFLSHFSNWDCFDGSWICFIVFWRISLVSN